MVASRATLPDLDALNPNELKALIVSQHELIVSRDSEIEQLKLLIAKLRRMQFGRSSEKLDRQIEQLELRLEASAAERCGKSRCSDRNHSRAQRRWRDRHVGHCRRTCHGKCEPIYRSKKPALTAVAS